MGCILAGPLIHHLCLDHVDAARAQGLDTVVDVHHPLPLRHVQHDVDHYVTARPPSSSATEIKGEEDGQRERKRRAERRWRKESEE